VSLILPKNFWVRVLGSVVIQLYSGECTPTFPKIGVSPKKVFTFYAGLLMQRSLKVRPVYMPSAPPNPPLIK